MRKSTIWGIPMVAKAVQPEAEVHPFPGGGALAIGGSFLAIFGAGSVEGAAAGADDF